jgi:2-polyprenyl-3-methyl-5-hydroxy-6-metoxy-1,4-benzoquinol methylase/uncharacterized protein YbaR (Trm112 family)
MRADLLDLMLCPVCGTDELTLRQAQAETVQYGERQVEEVKEGQVICQGCQRTFPIADYVLSFYDLMPDSVKQDGDYWGAFYRWHYEQGYTGYVDSRGDVPGFLSFQVGQVAPQTERERVAGVARLAEHPLVSRGGRLLDIGSGSGWTSFYLARRGFDVTTYDPGLENMRTAKEYAMQQGVFLECICAAMGSIRFKPETFDVVFAFHSLHHVPDLEAQMERVHETVKVEGCLAIDEHIQRNPWANRLAAALMEWAQDTVFPRYRDERYQSAPIPPGMASVNEDCSEWAIIPMVEKYFHIEMADYRYICLDRFRELYYLACDKSPDSLSNVERTIAILHEVMKRAFPDEVECVTLVGQKRKTLPPNNVDQFEQSEGQLMYRARTGPRLPASPGLDRQIVEPTPWWRLPWRVVRILWFEGGEALVKEIRSYFTWLRIRSKK